MYRRNIKLPPLPAPAPAPQSPHPQKFSRLVAKCTLQGGIESDADCFAGIEGDESDTNTDTHMIWSAVNK